MTQLVQTDLLPIFHTLWQINVLSHRQPLNTNALTLWTRCFVLAATTVAFGTLFPYAIVPDDGSLSATFEAYPRFLRHVRLAAFTGEADDPFVEGYFGVTTVDSIYETDLQVGFVICSTGVISRSIVLMRVAKLEEVIELSEYFFFIFSFGLLICFLIFLVGTLERAKSITGAFSLGLFPKLASPLFIFCAHVVLVVTFFSHVVFIRLPFGPASFLELREVFVLVITISSSPSPCLGHTSIHLLCTSVSETHLLVVGISFALIRQCFVSFLDLLEFRPGTFIRIQIRVVLLG